MDVVAAGVGPAAGGGKGEAAFLRHLQGVHIPPEKEHLSPWLSDTGGDSAPQLLGLDPQGLQLPADMGHRVGEIHPQLRHLVEGPAAGYQLLLDRKGFLVKGFHFQHRSDSFLILDYSSKKESKFRAPAFLDRIPAKCHNKWGKPPEMGRPF